MLDHFGLAYGDLSADERSSLWRPSGGTTTREPRSGADSATTAEPATIAAMAVTDDRPVADQLAELGAQLAWVRDYL